MMTKISKLLFRTEAIQVCQDDQPFLYTSGKIGPYYINTHYLFGSKDMAQEYLEDIERYRSDLASFATKVFVPAQKQYDSNSIYHATIDAIIRTCEKCSVHDYDFISGGERRDYFFSMMPAALLNKEHLSILKDHTVIRSDSHFQSSEILSIGDIKGARILHIADLVTEASSYIRSWIPALGAVGGNIIRTVAVVDRNQGGKEILQQQGIPLDAMITIDHDLFEEAQKNHIITRKQFDMIIEFMVDPDRFMISFIRNNPDFLEKQKALGGKNLERAKLCESLIFGERQDVTS